MSFGIVAIAVIVGGIALLSAGVVALVLVVSMPKRGDDRG
jgi:hypothetical protein